MHQSQIDQLRDAPIETPLMIIGGQSVLAISGKTLPVISPIDGQEIAHIPDAGTGDVDLAVVAARRSFEVAIWAGTCPSGAKKRPVKVGRSDRSERT